MKYYVSLFIGAYLLLVLPTANAQIVQSFCSGPSTLQAQYEEDAWYVAHEYLLDTDSNKWSSIAPIPSNVKDSVLAAILGVYNADLPARDTVISMFNIHTFKQNDLSRFEMFMDTSHPWVRHFLMDDIMNTTNHFVDSMALVYGFERDLVNWLPEWVLDYDAHVRVRCNSYYNTDFLARAMLMFDGVKFANAYVFGGDGNHIFYRPMPDYTLVTFRRGWGDCPAGCLYQRDWLFRVYPDCRVEFVSSYGDDLSVSPNNNITSLAVNLETYPNPAQEQVQVLATGLPNGKTQLVLRDLQGRIVLDKFLTASQKMVNTTLDVSSLLKGTYFLTVWSEGRLIARSSLVKM